jgi:hypothetical protein
MRRKKSELTAQEKRREQRFLVTHPASSQVAVTRFQFFLAINVVWVSQFVGFQCEVSSL